MTRLLHPRRRHDQPLRRRADPVRRIAGHQRQLGPRRVVEHSRVRGRHDLAPGHLVLVRLPTAVQLDEVAGVQIGHLPEKRVAVAGDDGVAALGRQWGARQQTRRHQQIVVAGAVHDGIVHMDRRDHQPQIRIFGPRPAGRRSGISGLALTRRARRQRPVKLLILQFKLLPQLVLPQHHIAVLAQADQQQGGAQHHQQRAPAPAAHAKFDGRNATMVC